MISDDVRQLEQDHTKMRFGIEKAMNTAMAAMGADRKNAKITPLFHALAEVHTELEKLVQGERA